MVVRLLTFYESLRDSLIESCVAELVFKVS